MYHKTKLVRSARKNRGNGAMECWSNVPPILQHSNLPPVAYCLLPNAYYRIFLDFYEKGEKR